MRSLTFALACGSLSCLLGQPVVQARKTANVASYMPAGLPGGALARGSVFSVFGTGLGPSSSPPLAFPLGATLGGVSIRVIQGSTGVDAFPTYVSPTQVNAILPSNTPLGAVSIRVTFNGVTGPPSPARVVNSSFGIISLNSGGFGVGVFQHGGSDQLVIDTPSTPAKPGQNITMYGTGLGPVSFPDNGPAAAGSLSTPVEVYVGGKLASTSYSGRAPGYAGLDQINFQVPPDVPLGCYVPVQVRTEGTTGSNTVTISVSADGSPCSDAANALAQPFLSGKKVGVLALVRAAVTEDVGLKAPGTVTTDSAMLTFQQESAAALPPFNPFFSLPPPGSCTVYTAAGDLFDGGSIPAGGTSGKFLNAGASLTLSTVSGTRTLARPADNSRNFQPLGYTFDGSKVPSSLVLSPGNLNVSAGGGADVGALVAPVTVAAPLTWTNRDQTSTIIRSQGVTVNWSGAPAGQTVLIFGGSVDLPVNATGEFLCVASPGAASFTVPAPVLANIPATHTNLLQSKGVVYVGALPTASPASFSASGLDVGAVLSGTFIGKTVIFQ